MQNKIAIAVASTVAVAVMGVVGWQSWNTRQLQQQVSELQQQLAAQSVAPVNPDPALLPPVGVAPPAASPSQPSQPLQLGQRNAPAPRNANPLNPPASMDPFDVDPFGNLDPFAEMERMEQQMSQRMRQLMSGFGGNAMGLGLGGGEDFDFRENKDNYQLSVTIPEGSNVELNTEVHGRNLTVQGKVSSDQQSKGSGSGSFRSQQTRQFAQTLRLPSDADASGITTKNEKDKVVVTVPKLAPGKQATGVSSPLPRGVI